MSMPIPTINLPGWLVMPLHLYVQKMSGTTDAGIVTADQIFTEPRRERFIVAQNFRNPLAQVGFDLRLVL